MSELTCFKAYDIRGEIDVNIDEGIAYRIGRAVAQHFNAKSIVIGFDAREASPAFAAAVSQGPRDAGANVINIGGEMNFKVGEVCKAIENVLSAYRADALSIDETDGVSLSFEDWRFNLRRSNTEPLVRLNVEGKGNADALETHLTEIADLLGGTRA